MRPTRQQAPAQPHVHDSHYKDKLVEMGAGLAQNKITMESAVNAGLLGGLSASDVRILAAAHQAETRRQELARQTVYPQASSGLPAQLLGGMPTSAAMPTHMLHSANGPSMPPAEPQALFDASKLGTSLFGAGVSSGGSAGADPPLALQQQGFFSFFGNDDEEHQAQDDDESSANNTTGTLEDASAPTMHLVTTQMDRM